LLGSYGIFVVIDCSQQFFFLINLKNLGKGKKRVSDFLTMLTWHGCLVLGSFQSTPAASENTTCFQSGQK